MGTLAELKARIASDLNRSDLTTQIADQIDRAITHYAARRLWFNETTGTTITAANVSTAAAPARLRVIDRMFITVGGQKLDLDEHSPAVIEDWLGSNSGTGQPTDYSRSDATLTFYPTPNAIFTVTAVGIFDVAPPPTDADGNAWTTEAADLIANHVVERLARVKTRNVALANDARLLRDEALSNLRSETTRRLTGCVTPSS